MMSTLVCSWMYSRNPTEETKVVDRIVTPTLMVMDGRTGKDKETEPACSEIALKSKAWSKWVKFADCEKRQDKAAVTIQTAFLNKVRRRMERCAVILQKHAHTTAAKEM